jgi:hypothetical protein
MVQSLDEYHSISSTIFNEGYSQQVTGQVELFKK